MRHDMDAQCGPKHDDYDTFAIRAFRVERTTTPDGWVKAMVVERADHGCSRCGATLAWTDAEIDTFNEQNRDAAGGTT